MCSLYFHFYPIFTIKSLELRAIVEFPAETLAKTVQLWKDQLSVGGTGLVYGF